MPAKRSTVSHPRYLKSSTSATAPRSHPPTTIHHRPPSTIPPLSRAALFPQSSS
ncbi:hypothetical protein BO70DRAFT_365340, partial [Aspergillus heteromorphus CBS 117.55]